MRVYESIADALSRIGVDAVFGGAGENAAGLMLALEKQKDIRALIAKNEQGAAFMACGYAMFTQKLGVCFATAGPGAFNLMSGLCVALTDSYPLLAITGYSTVAWEGRGALNETSGLVRTPDSMRVFDAITKKDPETGEPANFLITDPDRTIETLERAIRIAFEGRPGPVHIAVAEDISGPDVVVSGQRMLDVTPAPVTPDQVRIDAAADLLAQAISGGKKVSVLAGFGAIRSGAGPELRAFVERFQIPLLTTMDGKGVIDEKHPLAIGVFSDSGHKSAWKRFRESDVILAIGNSFAQHATFDFDQTLFETAKLVHINIDPGEIDKVYKVDSAIVADARLAIEALHKALEDRVGKVETKDFDPREYDKKLVLSVTPKLHPGRMVQAISRMMPPRAVVLTDAGAHAAWCGYYLEMRAGQNFRKPGTYGPMGIGVCGAIGVACAQPDRPVIAAVGDGSYLMMGFELMTAVQHDIPVIWVIFNDGEFKLIKLYQLSTFRDCGLVDFDTPDFAAYAEACGAKGYRVDRQNAFEEAFEDALNSGRPAVIDARITRLALPNYSPDPDGVMDAILERIKERVGV